MFGKHILIPAAAAILLAAGWLFRAQPQSRAEEPAAPATQPAPAPAAAASSAHIVAGSPEEAGRYIIQISGCNDCHTPGFMERGMAVPESEWLTGLPVGWRGPWGTTYASNLRLFAAKYDEGVFVAVLKARNARPPMPWPSVHAMSDQDLRAVFRYIRSLGPRGEAMPDYVPPGEEPKTPYFLFEPQTPGKR